ncbi:MAG: nucleotide sugar dehydrogenase [Dehalococcoidales bacterium]|nr:nucleotide sugar dehydrogenase [Dehalococcoidales bacterium]
MNNNRVCVIGIWHLGSVYSTVLADSGYQVTGVDFDAARIRALNIGVPPIFEPGLEDLLKKGLNSGKLDFTTDFAAAVKSAAFVMVSFDTPVDDNDDVDLSPVIKACEAAAPYLENETVLVISSQVPIGTCDSLRSLVKRINPGLIFDIAYVPENLRLGKAIDYFKKPDRIVIGADNMPTLDKVESLFSVIPSPKIRMSLKSAEMSKHALNAFMATSISFANEIANLCDETGADALDVARALKSDVRIGNGVPLLPGLAFAGGTLARDLKILGKIGREKQYETTLIDAVFLVNKRQNGLVKRKLGKIFGKIKGLNIGILGLTYKPGTSTLRRSASLEIINDLVQEGAIVHAYDPKADPEEVKKHKEFIFEKDAYDAARGMDALVIVTDWPEFKELDFNRIKKQMKHPVIIDAKNMLDSKSMIEKGFTYSGIGRGK